MKKIIKIWLIVMAVLAALGLVTTLAGLVMGGRMVGDLAYQLGPFHIGSFRIGPHHSVEVRRDHWDGRHHSCFAPAAAESVRGLDLNLAGMESVTIEEGDRFSLKSDGDSEAVTSWMEDGIWHIRSYRRYPMGNLVIQLPEGSHFEQVELDFAAGSLYSKRLSADAVQVEMTAGDVTLDGLSCEDLTVEMTAGSLSMNGKVQKEAEVDLTAGSFELTMPRPAGYTYRIDHSVGEITVDGHTFSGVGSSRDESVGSGGPSFDLDCMAGTINVMFKDVV